MESELKYTRWPVCVRAVVSTGTRDVVTWGRAAVVTSTRTGRSRQSAVYFDVLSAPD